MISINETDVPFVKKINYDGTLYYIQKNGNVYNSKGKLLKPDATRKYLKVSLSSHNIHKSFTVHRLVALAFIDNPDNKPQVNHIDENKLNNDVTNLEWVTPLENLMHSNIIVKGNDSHRKKVRCIDTGEIFDSVASACKRYGMKHSNVVACCKNRRRKCGGKKWEYV